MKNLIFDHKTGEFNWALVAVIALAGIFFFNIITANVDIPTKDPDVKQETMQILSDDEAVFLD